MARSWKCPSSWHAHCEWPQLIRVFVGQGHHHRVLLEKKGKKRFKVQQTPQVVSAPVSCSCIPPRNSEHAFSGAYSNRSLKTLLASCHFSPYTQLDAFPLVSPLLRKSHLRPGRLRRRMPDRHRHRKHGCDGSIQRPHYPKLR